MARCFEINNGASPGIPLRDHRVVVGDSKYGGKAVTVRPPDGAEIGKSNWGQEVLMSVPVPGVVLLIRDHSGYRGGWYPAECATARCAYENEEVPVGRPCPGCGARRLYSFELSEHRLVPARGLAAAEIGKLIAAGSCHNGEADYTGGGPEYLIRCAPGTRFSIRRSGRLYGRPAVLNVTVDEDNVTVTDAARQIDEQVAAESW